MNHELSKAHILSEHIPLSSPEFSELTADIQDRLRSNTQPFGDREVMVIRSIRKVLSEREQQAGVSQNVTDAMQEKVDAELVTFKKKLAEIDEKNSLDCSAFLNESLEDPQVSDFVEQADLAYETANTPELKLYALFLLGNIPSSIWEIIAIRHVERFEKQREDFKERLPGIISGFKDRVSQLIGQGVLPITVDEVEKRLANLSVLLVDQATQVSDQKLGSHRPNASTVFIRSNVKQKDQRHVVYHEMVHVISGRTLIKQTETGSNRATIDHQRSGLHFFGQKKQSNIGIFRWLNEAVTEDIAISLDGEDSDIGSYKDERIAFGDMCANGVSRELAYKAYFENYDPTEPEKVPFWKEFKNELDERYPEGGLAKLKAVDASIENKSA